MEDYLKDENDSVKISHLVEETISMDNASSMDLTIYYEMMFKRKSFRQFKCTEPLTEDELKQVSDYLQNNSEPLDKASKFEVQIVPREETTCKRGEYCILIYSQHDPMSLLNVGFVFSQLDLFLSSINIGTCWYGMGHPVNVSGYNDLPYTIMMAIGKATDSEFRKNIHKTKRKGYDEITTGSMEVAFIEYVRYSPSACNSQPWLIEGNLDDFTITMNAKEKMLIPKDKISFYNTIDLGIFLCSCERWLRKNNRPYTRDILGDNKVYQSGDRVARYRRGGNLNEWS